MNPLIKKQLDKLKVAQVQEYDDTTTHFVFQKNNIKKELELEENNCYLIEVEQYILTPPDGFSLHTNWNNGIAPKYKCMQIDVTKIMGKMIQVNAVGYDKYNDKVINDLWTGWLPRKSIKILEKL